MSKLPIAKDGIPYIIFLGVFSAMLYFIYLPAAIILFMFFLFIIYFFRDPSREIPKEKNVVISPADGRVMSVSPTFDSTFIEGDVYKISIFLSVFNVHINRSPIQGKVVNNLYRPGKFFPAFKSHASELNERNTIHIQGNDIKVIVHQITGFIARRIVCRVKSGDVLEQGERFGMIKFGSCTEIIVPQSIEIKVKAGDIVKGGKTIIGVKKDGI